MILSTLKVYVPFKRVSYVTVCYCIILGNNISISYSIAGSVKVHDIVRSYELYLYLV